ncbi:class I SAM-dependent methyltransferase [Microbacterium sp. 1.5R]|uniref:class I SAM-dependent methyltransferase n=1 Tax=Microbacterium sp. 1.5R TaxID=1916917 RepID=UPI0011A5D519|nr:class I SAM-dependent methyltransferase [Microbacterium sp. 1.5R]
MKDWDGTGAGYAASYESLCVGTVPMLRQRLGAADGRTMLDVGSGTGALAAEFLSAGWDVTACEPEPTMRAVAAQLRPQLTLVVGSLPALPFPDSAFDVTVANFVLNHVGDPRASARELVRVARGGLAASIWSTSPSWFWREVCDRAGLAPVEATRLPAEKDFDRSAAGFASMLEDAGWAGVEVAEHTWIWYASPQELWASAEGGVATAGAFYRALDADGRVAFRGGFDAVCADRSVGDHVPLEHTAAIATALAR